MSPDVSEPPGQDFPDDATTPGKLSVGGSVTGAIKDIEDTPDPADAFLVTLTPGTTYVVDLEGAAAVQGALYYSFLEVYTLNPTLVDSDGGPGRNAQRGIRGEKPRKVPHQGQQQIRFHRHLPALPGREEGPPWRTARPLAAVVRLVPHRELDRALRRRELPRHLLRPAPHPERQPR